MSFSATPQETLKNIGDFLDIAKGYQAILGDKEKLDALIKGVYSLSASEKALADEARASISEYQGLIEDHRKKKAALDAFYNGLMEEQDKNKKLIADANAQIEAKKLLNDSTLATFAAKKQELDDREKALVIQEKEFSDKKREFDTAKEELDVRIANSRKDEEDIKAKKEDLAKYENTLKDAAAKAQKLMQGL